jgi:hypothetical protein
VFPRMLQVREAIDGAVKAVPFLVPTTVAILEGRKAWFVWRHLTVIVDGSFRQPLLHVRG